jgi:hypothetical protein
MALISFKTYENGNYGKKETNTKNEKHGYFVPSIMRFIAVLYSCSMWKVRLSSLGAVGMCSVAEIPRFKLVLLSILNSSKKKNAWLI